MKDFPEKRKEQLNQVKIDTAYLREYDVFGASAPITVGECLHKALLDAHGRKAFESVAHLQLRLFSEMVMCLETFGAMLWAYSRWDKPRGIIGTLLDYRPGDVPNFIEKLNASNAPLRLLCFPETDVLLAHGFDKQSVNNYYSNDEFCKMVAENCRMYLSENIRGAYNKIKHAGLWIRHPEMRNPPGGKKVLTNDVFLITDIASDGAIEYTSFSVTGKNGIDMANKYLNNIQQIVRESKASAVFVAYCLEKGIMLPSQ